MSREDRKTRELHAYHDGEISWLGRFRVSRRLTRDERARGALTALSGIGSLLREHESNIAAPDLWDDIRARLPLEPAPAAAPKVRSFSFSPQWLGAGLAAAATVLALAFGLDWSDAPDPRSLRWLDPGGDSTMVLQDDAEATVIWVIESAGHVDAQTPRAFARRSDRGWS